MDLQFGSYIYEALKWWLATYFAMLEIITKEKNKDNTFTQSNYTAMMEIQQ